MALGLVVALGMVTALIDHVPPITWLLVSVFVVVRSLD